MWVGLRVLEVRHRAVFFLGRCDGVMDSASDFDLLDESVPQVRVSARTLALCGFFIIIYIFFFLERTLGECRINILIKKAERERRLERGKNDHRNPAGNRTRDLSLSGRLLYQLSY